MHLEKVIISGIIYDILHMALPEAKANVPSRLEPTGLDQADGKHPDGIAMVPIHG